MNVVKTVPEDRLPGVAHIWDELLSLQADLTLPLELPGFYAQQRWLDAPAVLDLGTGTGYHLWRLHERFPEKACVGIDIEPNFISLATRRHGGERLSFRAADIFEFEAQYPAVVCRLVAQHIRGLDEFGACLARLVEHGGILFNIEPDDARRAFWPRMPETERLFKAFTEHQRAAGLDRNAGQTFLGVAEAHGLEVLSHDRVLIPSTLPGYNALFVRFHELIFDLFERNYGIPGDYAEMRRELSDWQTSATSYAQLGIYVSAFGKPR